MSASSIPAFCSAIIVAAGASRRMGFDKLSCPLGGKPTLRRTVETFLAARHIAEVVVVCPPERWELLCGIDSPKPLRRVDGGKDRQDSVAAGLAAVTATSTHVAVHDGARPLVSPADIDRCVEAALQFQAATLARRVTETMQRSDEENFCREPVSRENLWCMETPQVFSKGLLVRACEHVAAEGLSVTDEVSAVRGIGASVKFVESLSPNLKITTPADIELAEALLKTRP